MTRAPSVDRSEPGVSLTEVLSSDVITLRLAIVASPPARRFDAGLSSSTSPRLGRAMIDDFVAPRARQPAETRAGRIAGRSRCRAARPRRHRRPTLPISSKSRALEQHAASAVERPDGLPACRTASERVGVRVAERSRRILSARPARPRIRGRGRLHATRLALATSARATGRPMRSRNRRVLCASAGRADSSYAATKPPRVPQLVEPPGPKHVP